MKQLLQLAMALVLPFGAMAQSVTVTMTTPGTLPEQIGADQKMEVKSLKVIGDINGTDIAYIREMGIGTRNAMWKYESNLMILDLSEANIVEGGDPFINSYPYPQTVANEVSGSMFEKFVALVELKLPNSVTRISRNGINNCGLLAELQLPSSLNTIEHYGVYYCGSISELLIPASTKVIEETAFYGSGIQKVTIEASEVDLQPGAFAGLENLTSIEASADNKSFSSIDGVLYSKDGSTLMLYPGGRDAAEYTVASGVTAIANYGFYGNGHVTEVVLPSTVESIGDYAFDGCGSLAAINFPEALKSIGKWAFAAGPKLTTVDLGNSKVTEVGDNAFFGNSVLAELTLSETLERVGEYAFSNGVYKELSLPATLRYIGKNGFHNTNLENVYAHGMEPAECDGDVFAQEEIASVLFQTPTAVLHVPEGTLDAYKEAMGFKYFYTIVDDIIATGIEGVVTDGCVATEYYDLSGRRVMNPENGIYVVRYSNGTTGKVVVR